MKKQAYTLIATFVLVGSMAVAAKAQTNGRAELIANIPFQFTVANKTMPAGEYRVLAVNADSASVTLSIKGENGQSSALVRMMTVNGKARESARLTFHRYGSQYFFAEAWIDGDSSGLQAPRSSAERAIDRDLGIVHSATESIALSTRR